MSWWRKALNVSFPLHGPWVSAVYNQWAKGRERKNGIGPQFSSQYGNAVPVIYGRPKVPGTILVYRRNISATNAPVRVLLGEAGVTAISAHWIGSERGSGALGSWTVQDGTQTAGTVTGDNPRNLAYKRSSILGAGDGLVGVFSALVMPRMTFELQGKFDATGHVSGDADPAQVVVDMLTNTTYGMGWDASRVTVDEWGDDAVLATRQAASYDTWVNGGPLALTMSRACTERKPCRDYLEEFLDATHSTVTWQFDTSSVATLYFVPRGDTAGGLFTPVGTVRYALTAADLIPNDAGELVEFDDEDGDTRSDQDNTLTIGFVERYPTDPIGFQVPATVEVEDPVLVTRDGLKRGPTIDLPCVTQRGPATALGKALLKHMLYRGRPTVRFRVGWRFARLDPLDFVSITDDAMGLSAYKVQVAAVEENAEGNLTIDAVPAPLALGTDVEHTTQSSDGDHAPENPWLPERRRIQLRAAEDGTLDSITFPTGGFSAVSLVAGSPNMWRLTFSPSLASPESADIRLESIFEIDFGTGTKTPFPASMVVSEVSSTTLDVYFLNATGGNVDLQNLGIGTGMNDRLVFNIGVYSDT